MAEHAATVAPHAYRVLFENERVRLLEVSMEPGSSTEMHSHPDPLSSRRRVGVSQGKALAHHAKGRQT